MDNAERYVSRWQAAGLVDESTAAAIRAYEATQAKPSGRQWQALLALIFGGILLGAGILLFVGAHWDELSPLGRMGIALAMLVFFHGLGLLVRERFSGFATTMHALGTISAGAAIALVGQIFNMQEHWPAAVLLWAVCAASGFLLLRDQFQQTLTYLLISAWIVSEWAERAGRYGGSDVYNARMILVIGAVYLVSFQRSPRRIVTGILFGVGSLATAISVGFLSSGWDSAGYRQQYWGFVPLSYRIAAIVVIVGAAAVGVVRNKRSAVPILVAATLAFALPWAQVTVKEGDWNHSEPSVLAYALVAIAAVSLVAYGVQNSSKVIVNCGMVAFAATIRWFYFSNIMDKLNRSLGLITLGILFLAGGWFMERTRRRLLVGMSGGLA